MKIFLVFVISVIYYCIATDEWAQYHDQQALESKLEEIHKKCPNNTRLYSIGQSVEGRDLVVIEFSTTPGEHRALKPEMKYVGNMHGNEALGRELLLRLAAYLCDQWNSKDKEIVDLLNRTNIHLLPSMNPDGFELAYRTKQEDRGWLIGRSNANGVDLNRNFPDLDSLYYYNEKMNIPRFDHLLDTFKDEHASYEPEVRAVGQWILSLPFVLSANLHEGDLVANYPFDESRSSNPQAYSRSPDDRTFRFIAETYAKNHAHMAKNDHAPCDGTASDAFARQGGITNGAKWYSVSGGMQDFNYLATNAFEITLELSCEKFPNPSTLPQFWEDNKQSLIQFMWLSHSGIKGVVVDDSTGEPIPNAVVWVMNVTGGAKETEPIKHPVTTWVTGDYFRPLIPGEYQIGIEADGYLPEVLPVNVTMELRNSATVLSFRLKPDMEQQVQQEEQPVKQVHHGYGQLSPEELQELQELIQLRYNQQPQQLMVDN
jgi:carboxypeptidase E